MELTVGGVNSLDAERSAELRGCEFSEQLVKMLENTRLDVSIEGENAELIALLRALDIEVTKAAVVLNVKFRIARADIARVSYEIQTKREASKEMPLAKLVSALNG